MSKNERTPYSTDWTETIDELTSRYLLPELSEMPDVPEIIRLLAGWYVRHGELQDGPRDAGYDEKELDMQEDLRWITEHMVQHWEDDPMIGARISAKSA